MEEAENPLHFVRPVGAEELVERNVSLRKGGRGQSCYTLDESNSDLEHVVPVGNREIQILHDFLGILSIGHCDCKCDLVRHTVCQR